MKRLLALVLVIVLAFSCTAIAETPDYLNTESEFPIVKAGEKIKLKIAVMPNALDNIEKLWFWEYCRQVMNIDFEIVAFTSDVRDEKINLMFAADELPDMILGCNFSVSELVRYGQVEGQLLSLNDYLTEEYTPNILKTFEERPESRSVVTALDGNIYSLPCVNPALNIMGNMPGTFIDMKALAETGMDMPKTLDELYEVLAKFKELHPNSIPLGGGKKVYEPVQLIWTALGVTANSATEPGFKNGNVTVFCGDELYGEYLSYMHKLFENGLIDADYYTVDSTMVEAELAEKRIMIYSNPVYGILSDSWSDWEAMAPLTSQFNDKQVWQGTSLCKPGAAVISAKTQYPELCMRFLDFFFTPKGGIYAWTGPMVDSEDTLGMVCGWYGNEQVPDVDNGKFGSAWEYVVYQVSPFNPNRPGTKAGEVERIKFTDPDAEFTWDLSNPDNFYRASKEKNEYPYVVDTYPTIYFDDATQQRISELKLVIDDFVNTESAKYITGVNSLDNLDAYYEQLKKIGYDEYLSYYVEAYKTYQANME